MTNTLEQQQALEIIKRGDDSAYGLLYEADPKLIAKFNRVDKALIKLLKEVKEHFPDATYYTASGGFNLLLGESHGSNDEPQGELLALSGQASISDGDF